MSEDGARVARFLETRREEDFDALYRAAAPALWRVALRLSVGDEAEADDLAQEVWLRAIARLGAFRLDARLGPWLAGIAWNCRRERERAAGRAAPGRDGDAAEVAVASTTPDAATRIDLAAALDSLPAGYRAVLLLHDLEGYTHAEIGEALGVSAGTSKSQLFRGRRALRARLRGERRRENSDAITTTPEPSRRGRIQ